MGRGVGDELVWDRKVSHKKRREEKGEEADRFWLWGCRGKEGFQS
jgi:hypothetical protein